MRPLFRASGGLKHGPEKAIKSRDDRGQVGKLGPSCTSHECGPLDLLLSVISELAGQRERTFARDLDASPRERGCEGKSYRLTIERSRSRESMDIEEILHPAVRQREPHHRLGLLGN